MILRNFVTDNSIFNFFLQDLRKRLLSGFLSRYQKFSKGKISVMSFNVIYYYVSAFPLYRSYIFIILFIIYLLFIYVTFPNRWRSDRTP